MKVDRYDKSGKKMATTVEVADEVWKVPMNEDLVAQALYVYRQNQRKGTAHTKSRGEVRGGGKKPWMQKGTGRARHGSIRSPIWVGGGVAFGPKSYKKMMSIPTKMQRTALACVLSDRVAGGNLRYLNDVSGLSTGKTKDVVGLLEKLGLSGSKVVVICSEKEQRDVLKGARNVSAVSVRTAPNVNVYDVAASGFVIVSQDGAELLEKRLK